LANSDFDTIAEASADDILEVFGIDAILDPDGTPTDFVAYFDETVLEQVRGNEVSIYGFGIQIHAKITDLTKEPAMGDEIEINGERWRVDVTPEVQKPWLVVQLQRKVV
jgi:hypothetical protein